MANVGLNTVGPSASPPASSPAGVNGSQFFVLLGDAPYLADSGVYNHFGMVTSGEEVVTSLQIGDTIRTIDISAQ